MPLVDQPMNIHRLDGPFGIAVEDIDVRCLTDEALKHLLTALYENRFAVLRTGGLSQDEYLAFARRAGDPIRINLAEADYPEIARITNVGVDIAEEKRSAAHWHSDQSFKEVVSSVTMLYSVQAPEEGGDTRFCDLAAAYADLPETDRILVDDLIVEHRHGVSVAARVGDHIPIPPRGWDQSATVYHPLVRSHPVTGERTLYAISGTSQGIRGMDQAKAEQLLRDLCDHAFQDRFMSRHHHRVHDILMWDNPTTMHSASHRGRDRPTRHPDDPPHQPSRLPIVLRRSGRKACSVTWIHQAFILVGIAYTVIVIIRYRDRYGNLMTEIERARSQTIDIRVQTEVEKQLRVEEVERVETMEREFDRGKGRIEELKHQIAQADEREEVLSLQLFKASKGRDS